MELFANFKSYESIYKFSLSVSLFVCLYPINVKTAEPIQPNFFVGPHMIEKDKMPHIEQQLKGDHLKVIVSVHGVSILHYTKILKSLSKI